MNIVAVSDTHKEFKKVLLPEADVFVHAGDLDAYGYSSELKDFCKWLEKQSQIKHKIVIAGNHDGYIAQNNMEARQMFMEYGIIYLENSGCEIDGVKFWGSPVTPKFCDWFFMINRGPEIKRIWDMIPNNTDVLITHGPCYGILDATIGFDNLEHVGCSNLTNRVKEIKPKVHIFGHIHHSHGFIEENSTKFYNVAVMNEEYDIEYEPTIITI